MRACHGIERSPERQLDLRDASNGRCAPDVFRLLHVEWLWRAYLQARRRHALSDQYAIHNVEGRPGDIQRHRRNSMGHRRSLHSELFTRSVNAYSKEPEFNILRRSDGTRATCAPSEAL